MCGASATKPSPKGILSWCVPSKYEIKFYSKTGTEKRLEESKRLAIEEELTEYEIVKQIYMRICTQFKRVLESCGMRTKKPRLLTLAKGYTFDIFCFLNNGQFRNNRLGIDVYTRLPLSEAMVQVFVEKVNSVGCSGRIYARECQSSMVPILCRKHRIELKYLKNNTTIDYTGIRRATEMKLKNAGLW